MGVRDYEKSVKKMISDDPYLYAAMIRDQYYLGKVLARKYKLLRLTYIIFMIGLIISVGGLLGTAMFLNGWFVMHPKQKVVIASATRVAQGGQPLPEAPACSRRVVLASRTNLLLSIPTIFFMVAASHYSIIDVKTADASLTWFWIIILVIMGVLEINALTGTQGVMKKPLDSLSASLLSGIILTVVLYLLFPALL